MANKLIQPNLNASVITAELRPLSTGVGVSDILDLLKFPQGTVQVYGGTGGDAPVGLTGNVEISNLPDAAWVTFATFATANLGTIVGPTAGGTGGFVLLPVGIRYVRVNVTALTSGKAGAVINVPAQT